MGSSDGFSAGDEDGMLLNASVGSVVDDSFVWGGKKEEKRIVIKFDNTQSCGITPYTKAFVQITPIT